MSRRVFLATADLLFRAKLGAAVAAHGAEVVKDERACDVAVVAVEAPGALERIRKLVARRTRVLAYGAHVRADLLRAARDAGAEAVPNCDLERRLANLLTVT